MSYWRSRRSPGRRSIWSRPRTEIARAHLGTRGLCRRRSGRARRRLAFVSRIRCSPRSVTSRRGSGSGGPCIACSRRWRRTSEERARHLALAADGPDARGSPPSWRRPPSTRPHGGRPPRRASSASSLPIHSGGSRAGTGCGACELRRDHRLAGNGEIASGHSRAAPHGGPVRSRAVGRASRAGQDFQGRPPDAARALRRGSRRGCRTTMLARHGSWRFELGATS